MLTSPECPCCGNRDSASLKSEGAHWRCLACGNGWESEVVPASPRATAGIASRLASELRGIEQVIALLRAPDYGLSQLAGVLSSGDLQAYLETRLELDDALRGSITEALERLRTRPRLALFTLRCLLTDDPLRVTATVEVSALADLVRVLAPAAPGREAVLAGLRAFSADGRLGEWLRTRAPVGGADTLAALDAVLRAYPGEPDLVVYALLWRLAPDLGFPVGDGWVKTTKELAAWIDRDDDHRTRGLELLDRGWIPTWLASTGRLDDHHGLLVRIAVGLTRGARVETLLWLLDPELPGPRVVAEPPHLELRMRRNSNEATVTVMLKNAGRGYAWGDVDLEGGAPGIALLSKSFDGAPAQISIRATRGAMGSPPTRALALVVRVRGARADQILRVPLRLHVDGPVGDHARIPAPGHIPPDSLARLANIIGAVAGGLIGIAVGAIVGLIVMSIAVLIIAIPALFIGIFLGDLVEAALDFLARLIVGASMFIGMILGGTAGAVSWSNSGVKAVAMSLVVMLLIALGLANFDFIASFLTDMANFSGS